MPLIHPKIMLICGEESGDMRAAALVKAIKSQNPGATFSGIGGERCRKEGVDLIADITQLAVIGFVEVLRHYGRIKRVFDLAVAHAKKEKPDAIILVDYPGFNLRLAKALKPLGIKIIYYVSPQVWAWKASRVKLIKAVVDRMIVLFPFEKEFYAKYNYETDFVGHPLVDEVRADKGCSQFIKELGLNEKERIVGLLPGSREKEVSRLLPVMLEAAERIRKEKPGTQFLLLKAKNLGPEIFDKYLKARCWTVDARREKQEPHNKTTTFTRPVSSVQPLPLTISDDYYNALNACDVCIVASGTATLETALMEKPMAVVYKTSWITYFIAKLVVKIPFIALANIVAGKKVAEELLQNNASPNRIASTILSYLKDADKLKSTARELKIVRAKLGNTGASQRAGKVVLSELGK